MVITKFVCDLLIVSAVSLGAHQQEGDPGAVVDYLGHPLGSEMADINKLSLSLGLYLKLALLTSLLDT